MTGKVYGPEHYHTEFDPYAYLDHYYSSKALSDGARLSLFAMPNFAKQLGTELKDSERETLIDVGSGPTIYSALCFRNVVKRVYLTDYVQKNLDLIQEWLDQKSSFDWKSVASVVSRFEGNGATDDTEEIEAKTRKLLLAGGIHLINVHHTTCDLKPTLNGLQFDVLVSVFCLESACSSHEQYREAMKNMLHLLRPGGRLILGSVLEDDCYNSGKSKLFTLLNVTEEDIICELQKNDIDFSSLRKIVLNDQGVIFLMGTKKQFL